MIPHSEDTVSRQCRHKETETETVTRDGKETGTENFKETFTETAKFANDGVPSSSAKGFGGKKEHERLRPLWIPSAQAITVKQALEVFKDYSLTEDTLRRLVKRFRLANQTLPGAPLRISAPGLAMVLDGDERALALLRQDDRQDPDVWRYFLRLGIPTEF
ncbi:hypothetical protein FJ976_01635 [Mesorhizobium sp. B1-1-9]|uniref:hypothetical protein n=1 Tax=Mesorhizobium sp. B1-1-9 TaxID=2589975 RepID=UPI00112B2983|nr:hypothetical protein [Mesorhizobium sp. B1-1-9]TPN58637.1 hypothetical protein FJ976_01635 [Mesorhizobium sp. B1-1-9]